MIVAIINNDLQGLIEWGDNNLTTFEPDKSTYTVISRKKKPFDPHGHSAGTKMGGFAVEQVSEVKLVGFLFDSKLTFAPMVDKLAKKARIRIGALRRLEPMLNSENIKLMYTMFVRSIMEYGNIVYMGAADSHLEKLDRVQRSAEKLGGFTIESLKSRREAAAAPLALDMLDGTAYGELQDFAPVVCEQLKLCKKRTRHDWDAGIQLKTSNRINSLNLYKRSFLGSIHKIWAKIPAELRSEGESKLWRCVKSRTKKFFTGKWTPMPHDHDSSERKKIKSPHDNVSCSMKLNNELNIQTDWAAIHKHYVDQGISIIKK